MNENNKFDVEYVIIQAGGKGTRLRDLTKNKPKALVPVDNRPMIFHLFEKFPEKKFIIIADYKAEVMEKYLNAFAKVKYLIVGTDGMNGTCSGISNALDKIPQSKAFMLIWSDLVLAPDFKMPTERGNYIGLSQGFECRWKYENNNFEEMKSTDCGVAGMFIFENKSCLSTLPPNGEFVRWLKQKSNCIHWKKLSLMKTKEYGVLEDYLTYMAKKTEQRCRPFNNLEIQNDHIVKTGIDEQGKNLALREIAWYDYVRKHNYSRIPQIYSFSPLDMERIQGKNVFEYSLSYNEKLNVLKGIVNNLLELHKIAYIDTDYFSIQEAYINKTLDRLEKVRNLIPLANERHIIINRKRCRNIFFHLDEFRKKVDFYKCPCFTVIHGDNTFSNILLKDTLTPVFIDPRGYFGYQEIFGDPMYDWAKLYYSIVGNYDKFNLKKFSLDISDEVLLQIESNDWEDMEPAFFEILGNQVDKDIVKFLHAVIWLSLTTYAWEDYDSICGAFYNGLYYLEDVL